MNSHYILLITSLVSWISCRFSSSTWNVTVRKNPHCPHDCDSFNLIYVKNVNNATSTHYLFAAGTRIRPSILIISGGDAADVDVDWDRLSNNTSTPSQAISLNNATDSLAVVFKTLVEYDDSKDTADMRHVPPDTGALNLHPLGDLQWTLLSSIGDDTHILSGDEVFEVNFLGNDTDGISKTGGYVILRVMVSNARQHNPRMPRLQFVPGSNLQFEVILSNLYSNFTRGRFGLQLALISDTSLLDTEDFDQFSSFTINDEVTPGIFEIVNLRLGNAASSQPSQSYGYMQVKPVCYTSDRYREIKSSRDANVAPRRDRLTGGVDQWGFLRSSLPYSFYGHRISPLEMANPVGIRLQNISLGTPEDGFFAGSNFLAWSACVGHGTLPADSFSPLLIGLLILSSIIIVGSLLVGPFLILFFRKRHRPATSEQLFDTISVTESLA